MENVMGMKALKTDKNLYKDIPDLVLLEKCLRFLMINNFLVQVTIVSKLHDNTTISNKFTIDFCPRGKPIYTQQCNYS